MKTHGIVDHKPYLYWSLWHSKVLFQKFDHVYAEKPLITSGNRTKHQYIRKGIDITKTLAPSMEHYVKCPLVPS